MNAKSLPEPSPGDPWLPSLSLMSVLKARRDLFRYLKREVDFGTALTIEMADLLILLFEPHIVLDPAKRELPRDAAGYVKVTDIRDRLAYNQVLLSRRLIALRQLGLIEWTTVRDTVPLHERRHGLHGNAALVRITPQGLKRVRPIWEQFRRIAEQLIGDHPLREVEIQERVNLMISNRIRELEGRKPARRNLPSDLEEHTGEAEDEHPQ